MDLRRAALWLCWCAMGLGDEHPCVGKVVLGVWTSAKTKERRRAVLETWFVEGCVVWLSCCEESALEDAVVTGGPDTYLGVTYRGLVGLKLMRERWPRVPWYGVLGDDNYVHWPSLLRGLEGASAAEPIVAGEKVWDAKSRTFRFMGGAGIFHNGAFADAVRSSIPAAAQRSLASTLVHDLFFSRFVHEHRANLTHWDFVFSTEPGVYVCGHAKRLADTWTQHPPAVFHRFRSLQHMHRMHRIATSGTAADRSSDGIMKRTRFNRHTRCSVGAIADALCAAWHNCPSPPGKPPQRRRLLRRTAAAEEKAASSDASSSTYVFS